MTPRRMKHLTRASRICPLSMALPSILPHCYKEAKTLACLASPSTPRESQGQRNLAGYSPWGRKESDTTKRPTHTHTLPSVLPHCYKDTHTHTLPSVLPHCYKDTHTHSLQFFHTVIKTHTHTHTHTHTPFSSSTLL